MKKIIFDDIEQALDEMARSVNVLVLSATEKSQTLAASNKELSNKLRMANENISRLIGHLEKIALYLDVEWIDRDFPIEEALDKIKRTDAKR